MTETANTPPKKLTPKQAIFVAQYIKSGNATQAYKKAYKCTTAVADANGSRLLGNARVDEAVSAARKRLAESTEIQQADVLKRLWTIATADPRKLTEYRRTCCRHCWGVDFEYQWSERQWIRHVEQSRRSWEKRENAKPEEIFLEPICGGGFGFRRDRVPNAKCPDCEGDGVASEHIHDTRRYKPESVALFAGVKRTRDGLEIKMHDQLAALVKVGEQFGMFKGLNLNLNLNLDDLNDAQVEHIAKGGSIATLPR